MADETEAYEAQRKARQVADGGDRVDLECTTPGKHGPHVYGKQNERWCRGKQGDPNDLDVDASAAREVIRRELLFIFDLMAKGVTDVVCPVCSRGAGVRCLGQHPHRQRLVAWLSDEEVMDGVLLGYRVGA